MMRTSGGPEPRTPKAILMPSTSAWRIVVARPASGRLYVAFRAFGLAPLFHNAPCLITEHEFLDLSGRCLGQCAVNKNFGTLKARRACPAKGDDIFVVGLRRSRLEFEECAGVSPHFGSGRATTAASMIAGCWVSTSSTSRLEMFSPPEIMMSLERSLISIAPSGCQTARSPGGTSFRPAFSPLRPRFLRYLFITVLLRIIIADRSCHRAEPGSLSRGQRPSPLRPSDRQLWHAILTKAFVSRQCIPFRQEHARGRGSVGFGRPHRDA